VLQVAIHALQILNELIAMEFKALASTALLSVVLVVAKYAAGVGPVISQDIRLQAAYFLQFLSQTNLLTAQLLVTCQVHRRPIGFSLRTPVHFLPLFSTLFQAVQQLQHSALALFSHPIHRD
jgi:hypothetical protein